MAKSKDRELDAAIGRRLTEHRNNAQMSQKLLGVALNVTFQQIQKYESGGNGLSCGQLRKVCVTFNVSPNEIMGWQGQVDLSGAPIWDRLVAKHGSSMKAFGERLENSETSSVLKLMDLFNSVLKKDKRHEKDGTSKSR